MKHYQRHFLKKLISHFYGRSRKSIQRLISLIKGSPLRENYYFINKEKQLAYLIIPKVASSSFKYLLLDESNPSATNIHAHPQARKNLRKKLRPSEQNYFRFTFVRNPFKRLASFYKNKFQNRGGKLLIMQKDSSKIFPFHVHQSFKEVVQVISEIPLQLADYHFKPQSDIIRMAQEPLDFIGHLETIQKDYGYLQEKFSLPNLTHRNQSSSYNYMDCYDLESLERARKYYQNDIEQFGYDDVYDKIKQHLLNKKDLL